MSAYMVDKTHIDALLTAGLYHASHGPLQWFDALQHLDPAYDEDLGSPEAASWAETHHRTLTPENAERAGVMLLEENRRSFNYRYSDHEPAYAYPYTFTRLPGIPDPLIILAAIACYEYQACEHPGWRISEAYLFCDALRRQMVRVLTSGRGVWEITDPNVFGNARHIGRARGL